MDRACGRLLRQQVWLAHRVSPTNSGAEEQGLVSRAKRRPRTTRLQPCNDPADQRQPARGANQGDGFKVIPVPLVGRIPAGGPKLADESIDDVIPLPAQLVGHGELIMLSVDGDSMRQASRSLTATGWLFAASPMPRAATLLPPCSRATPRQTVRRPSKRSRDATGTSG